MSNSLCICIKCHQSVQNLTEQCLGLLLSFSVNRVGLQHSNMHVAPAPTGRFAVNKQRIIISIFYFQSRPLDYSASSNVIALEKVFAILQKCRRSIAIFVLYAINEI